MDPSTVTTHSGYKADEYPTAFTVAGGPRTVVDIEDRWYDPDCSYFRLFADDAERYILRQDRHTLSWTVKPL